MATKKQVKKVDAPKTVEELQSELLVAQNDLVEARRSLASRELANTTRVSELRKTIARIKTALSHIKNSEEKA